MENCVPLISASPSFALSSTGFKPAFVNASAPGHVPPPKFCFPVAHHYSRHVRKGRKIARSANRALRRDHGCNAFGQHILQIRSTSHQTNTGGATSKDQQFQHHHQSCMTARYRWADTAAMGQDEIALQDCGILGRNLDTGELPKTCIDPINRDITGSGLGDLCPGRFHCRAAGWVQGNRAFLARKFGPDQPVLLAPGVKIKLVTIYSPVMR